MVIRQNKPSPLVLNFSAKSECLVLVEFHFIAGKSPPSIRTVVVFAVLIPPLPAVSYWHIITARLTSMTQSSTVDYEWLASERFKGTKLHGYDQVCEFFGHRLSESAHPPQITTVSQNAINRQIQLQHKSADADSLLRQFTTSTYEKDDYTYVVHLPCHKAALT